MPGFYPKSPDEPAVFTPKAKTPEEVVPPERLARIRMEGLEAQWHNCKRCELCHTRKRILWGWGSTHAPIMVISPAPSMWLDKSGKIIGDGPGRILNRGITSVGLQAARDVYMTFVVKCCPGETLDEENNENRPSEISEQSLLACRKAIEAQIKIVRPAVLMLHGRGATKLLIGDPRPMVQFQGHVRQYSKTCVAVSTHSPGGLMFAGNESKTPEYMRAWQEAASRLNLLGRIWRPDAEVFKTSWRFDTVLKITKEDEPDAPVEDDDQ